MSYNRKVKRRASMPGWIAVAGCLEQEPGTPFGLIDKNLKNTSARHVSMLIAQAVRFTHMCRELFVGVAQLRKHVERSNVVHVVVQHTLQASDMVNGA